jgi:PAS domain S-box-containing protein
MRKTNRETRDLWLAVGIILPLILYNLTVNFQEPVRGYVNHLGEFPLITLITNSLFIWSMGLLWIAYRRWSESSKREAEFSDILSSTGPELVMVVDPQRRILMCNDSVGEIFGYDVEEVVNLNANVLYEEGNTDRRMNADAYETLKKAGFHRGEATGKKKNGELVTLEVITTPLKQHEGLVVLIQDITERKNAEQKLSQAKEDAERANRSKEQLLAELETQYQELKKLESLRDSLVHMVVHDMKSPLQSIQLALDLIHQTAEERIQEEDAECLDVIASQARHLTLMIHSLLDVSRLNAGKLPLNPEPGCLAETLQEATALLDTLRKENPLNLCVGEIRNPISYDPDIIRRVLLNLLTNAMKFSPEGESIMVELVEKEQELRVSITDKGPGIPEAYQEKIFEKFGQVEDSNYRQSDSSGLGLTFCKMAVQAHGGGIGVESEMGKGSTFWFTLPVLPAIEPAVSVQPEYLAKSNKGS